MLRVPQRLRRLKILVQAAASVRPDEENLQGPPEIANLLPKKPPKSTSQIKIICMLKHFFKHICNVMYGRVISHCDILGCRGECRAVTSYREILS